MKKPDSLVKERKTITAMVRIYCRSHHKGQQGQLCLDCWKLQQYALHRLEHCPFGAEKGPCSKCKVHCYRPKMRQQIREVMRYSGRRIFIRHPVLAICHLMKKWRADP